jgi:DNA-binding NarL/FixJ family response regulator
MASETDSKTTQASSRVPVAGSPQATRALNAEVVRYCRDSRLTPRESDIVKVLADGVVRIKDIATRLGLSPNTVNNHVNSIFLKTKTRSKSELLTILLNRLATELRWARLMRSPPRVLCLGSSTKLAEELAAYQFRAQSSAPELALSALKDQQPQFIVHEVSRPNDCVARLQELRSVSNSAVIFVGDGIDDEARADIMNAGAVDCLSLPVTSEQLALLMLGHLIEEENECRDFIETEYEAKALKSEVPLRLRTGSYGSGGLFLSAEDIGQLFGRELERGEWVEFSIDGGTSSASVRGRVEWQRKGSSLGRAAGVGVRVLGTSRSWQRHLERALANESLSGRSTEISITVSSESSGDAAGSGSGAGAVSRKVQLDLLGSYIPFGAI